MPAIGFGTWQILFNARTKQAVLDALAAGYRQIDTARIYGNEKGVGAAIRESGIDREKIFLTTKLWNSSHGLEKSQRAFDASLDRLGQDYVNLYLIHWPVTGHRVQTWKGLEKIRKSGRAKDIGVSNYTVRHLEELMHHCDVVPAVNQIEFHPFLYEEQLPLLEFCRKHHIMVQAYSPLAHGSGLNDPTLTSLAAVHDKSPAQVMLRWAVQHGTVPIPKSTHAKRIHENLDVFDFKLSAREMEAINKLSNGMRTCWDPNRMA